MAIAHITEEHCELAGLRLEVLQPIADAERVFEGTDGERLAVREIAPGKWLVAVYREDAACTVCKNGND